ncbi:hypothetical protein C7C45_32670 [Micromonospora arborensis]|uniref:DUF4240 domain-containing protein n=1 Tax=Micromonospora arborensis TaxID=2116518 RepID=A0A318NBF3_9ACTN|nr:DUF4240 domain-containing protein [Micromonospora arborensis]PYC62832.1 hypothetical protein C7C45_32670 [Micromonospora arborensis]
MTIVEGARAEAGSDTERVAQVLLCRLRALTPHEIEQFEELWFLEQDELYCWPIRDAATLLLGPFDDDDFLAVQDWIVSHGRQVMRRVQANPDTLVELAPDRHNARIDWFCGLPIEAHIAATGAPSAIDGPSGPDTPLGTPADLTNETLTRQRFPNLTTYLDANQWIERPWKAQPADHRPHPPAEHRPDRAP